MVFAIKRIIVLLIMLSILLCGCYGTVNGESQSTVSVVLPDIQTADTVNGYLKDGFENSQISTTENIYFLNNVISNLKTAPDSLHLWWND